MLKKYLANEEATLAFAASVAKCLAGGCFMYLSGDLGAGKTTFARGLLRGLGFTEKVKSPSYTLIEPYELGDQLVYHCDFYRINDPNELEDLDIHGYFTDSALCLVEWPEKAGNMLPAADLICTLTQEAEGRQILIESRSARGEAILQRFPQD